MSLNDPMVYERDIKTTFYNDNQAISALADYKNLDVDDQNSIINNLFTPIDSKFLYIHTINTIYKDLEEIVDNHEVIIGYRNKRTNKALDIEDVEKSIEIAMNARIIMESDDNINKIIVNSYSYDEPVKVVFSDVYNVDILKQYDSNIKKKIH
ncbi:hypothetical protein BCR36DRAFT_415318 [Piromyces finnis]|uniref:Uncharacterized protein n=1 Tax=Piromyces finnis TaxID=1754191 RepID=A0A1Y1UZB8_9FUNG|nr:hypothetical protein BCR36DRAFT_375721 [Piromyces finnis]ORX43962.1 hypothetical protein BCR36DRAFT_415318 [Piromyces finnis]|eukprot:ORX36993.1 hypothetical protein BCR36DRAFT_375721 [Piromyces finnis]